MDGARTKLHRIGKSRESYERTVEPRTIIVFQFGNPALDAMVKIGRVVVAVQIVKPTQEIVALKSVWRRPVFPVADAAEIKFNPQLVLESRAARPYPILAWVLS